MGQGSSTNNKQQQLQKENSTEQVESIESNDDEDINKSGSLKNKWLRQKPSEEKPKKNKKNDKKKKKKDDQEEVSSATCISEPDRSSLRHSRIELHLEECQPAPDEDDAISLSSCGDDLQKNLKDIENDELPSLLTCDYSSSSMTASPGESLSSGQDSGFARGNTIHSVSSEDEHNESIQQTKENTSDYGTKLITPAVEVTEKCQDYIEKSYPFNSTSPVDSPASPNNNADLNSTEETTISTSPVPRSNLETQNSITEIPKITSQTDIIKDSDLVTGMVKELVNETLESAVEFLAQEYKTNNKQTEHKAANMQDTDSQNVEMEGGKSDGELNETEVLEVASVEKESKEINEDGVVVVEPPAELFQDEVSVELVDNAAIEQTTMKIDVDKTIEENIVETNRQSTDPLSEEQNDENILVEAADSASTETVEKSGEFETNRQSTDPLSEEQNDENILVEAADSASTETVEKSGEFFDLSYSLKVTPCVEKKQFKEPQDKLEIDTNETETFNNSDSVMSEDPTGESINHKNNYLNTHKSENVSSNIEMVSSSKPSVETNPNDAIPTMCSSINKSSEHKSPEICNSLENLPNLSVEVSEESMTEISHRSKETSSFSQLMPEIVRTNESLDNWTDSSNGSTTSPQPSKESKEETEQSSLNTAQPITDSTTGAVFV